MTLAGKWGRWEDVLKGQEKEALSVVGVGLGGAKLWSPRRLGERGSRRQDFYGRRMSKVRSSFDLEKEGSPPAEQAAMASSAALEVGLLGAEQAGTGAWCDSPYCWAAPRLVEQRNEKVRELSAPRPPFLKLQTSDTKAHSSAITLSKLRLDLEEESLDSTCTFDEDLDISPTPYFSLINDVFKTETLTKTEMKFKNTAMAEIMKLHKQIKQLQIQQEPLIEESRQLHTEKLNVQAENKLFLEYLTNKTEDYRRQAERLWNSYIQIPRDFEERRKKSASKYAKQTAVLEIELMRSEEIQLNLTQQLESMRDLLILKEKQEREIETLQEEKKKTHAETHRKIQERLVPFLQEKAVLEKQLSEPDMRQSGKRKRKPNSFRDIELAARQHNFEFHCGINRENLQLQKELLQLTKQFQKLQSAQSKLNTKKQQLQQEQWYMECTKRGRQRLQRLHNWCPEGQDAPETTVTPPLGTKSRINTK
ncbi:PREDICTED: coiled-coil domain-containing protein 121 [Condylura cristata]|uniref:coiled-coil domain-containing protein 121 n=1 Tax=Condylura cristata TaxID=143302 RepID=UPI0003346458|nr:PREDICTED: coiled-coil domain-containing protein 121 [Condylura cristata]